MVAVVAVVVVVDGDVGVEEGVVVAAGFVSVAAVALAGAVVPDDLIAELDSAAGHALDCKMAAMVEE